MGNELVQVTNPVLSLVRCCVTDEGSHCPVLEILDRNVSERGTLANSRVTRRGSPMGRERREGMESQDSAGGVEGTALFTYVWKARGAQNWITTIRYLLQRAEREAGQAPPLLPLLFSTSFTVN